MTVYLEAAQPLVADFVIDYRLTDRSRKKPDMRDAEAQYMLKQFISKPTDCASSWLVAHLLDVILHFLAICLDVKLSCKPRDKHQQQHPIVKNKQLLRF